MYVLRVCGVILCNIELKNEGKSNRFTSNLICPVNANFPILSFTYNILIHFEVSVSYNLIKNILCTYILKAKTLTTIIITDC